MSAWLAGVLAEFLYKILSKLVGDVAAYVAKQKEIEKRREAVTAEAQASVEPLKNAQTSQEIDNASDSALNGL
jgi:outer membrane murein-binding lipoprotein Lpp